MALPQEYQYELFNCSIKYYLYKKATRCYHKRTMLEYLEKLVAFHPVTNDQKSVLNLLEYVNDHLKEKGLKTQLIENTGIYNLYASPYGAKHSSILLQSHVDVVPGGQPFHVDDTKAYGRGVYDMLFATAAYMRLANELHEQGIVCDIAFMLSGDEETNGKNGVGAMLNDGFTTDVCILPDAGDDWGSLNISAKGFYQPVISIRGKSHHGSRPWEGDGAAIKLARFLIEVEKFFDTSDQFNSTLTVARITAGDVQNQGPAEAEATLDIRYKDQTDLARIIAELELLLKKYDGEIIGQIEGLDYQLDPDVPMIKKFLQLYEQHAGHPIRQTRAHGSSDARYFSKHNMSVISFRPDGGNIHSDQEWISLPHYEKFYQLIKDYVITTATIKE